MADGYTPDPRHRLQRATRFFARARSFDLECPRCGTVYQIRENPIRKKAIASAWPNWDPYTGRFKCTTKGCERSYIIGLVAWPISDGGRGTASQPPEDQIPNARQLAQLRAEGGGWWMADEEKQRFKQPHTTNLTTEEERPEYEDDET